jgi:hypothetical protein
MNKTNTRISVLSFATILAAVAAPAVASGAVIMPAMDRPPKVICNHLPCPDPDPQPRFEIMSGVGRSVSKLTRNLGSRDMTAAAVSLGRIFEGGSGGAEAAPAVTVPAPLHTIRAVRPILLKKAQRKSALTPVGWKGCAAGALAGGASGCGVGSAAEDGFNEVIDRIGNHLRDNY